MQIRRGVDADIPWLLTQLRVFASHYPVALPIVGTDSYSETLLGTLMRDQYLSVATLDDGTPVGLIAGALVAHPYNPELLIVSELWWWVTPEARGSRAGMMLLADLERWADAHDAPLSLTMETNTALNDRHLTKRGYVPVERQFIRLPGSFA